MKTRVMQNEPGEPHKAAAPAPDKTAPPTNLAGRMGWWSAQHWKTAVFSWLAFVIAAVVFGMGVVGTKQADANLPGPGESGRADKILNAGFKQPAGETVLIQSATLQATDPEFQAAIKDTISKLSGLDQVINIRSPLGNANSGQISEDGRSALIDFQIRGDSDDAGDLIDPVIAKVAAVQAAYPELFVGQFGDASADKEVMASFKSDLKKAGLISVPITLIILIVAFGALVAAGIPILLALTAVMATLGFLAIPSHYLPMDEAVSAMVLLIGLAVGVDYSLFYLKREREERAAGRSEEAALQAAASTSGRSVLISGLTVMVAMAGMFLTGDKGFAAFGLATMLVVGIAMLGSLTVLPALLSRLGDNVDRGRVPFVSRLRRDDGEGRIWGAIVDRVLKRPLLSALLSGGLLLAIAAPAITMHTVEPGIDTYPQGLATIDAYNKLQAAFPGAEIPANVVIKAADVHTPAIEAAIADLKEQALASGKMHEPIITDVNSNGTVVNVAIPVDGEGTDAASDAALATLRNDIIPVTIGVVPNVEYGVTGFTAESRDFTTFMKSVAPRVFVFVLLFAFLLMLFAFRSIVLATKAILLNLLSVAAAYGVLVLVFQHGWGHQLLGFTSTAGVVPIMPIFLFVILFGLSMDYHVFILSRVRELYDKGATTDEAISGGIKSTAGVVTSAAIVMVAVFAVFGTLGMMIFKQFGVGLAAAILIDATIVRAVLLPATMSLLGERNWYLPSWLEWLPHLEHGGAVERVEVPSAFVGAGK
jgi:uncharacterized membrane protein YdfJ with MMPL/SSD domain